MSPADGESDSEVNIALDKNGHTASTNRLDTSDIPASSATHTPNCPPTPGVGSVPKIAETPPPPETPGSIGSTSDAGSPFMANYSIGSVHTTPRCSIPGGEKSKNYIDY